jgi:hypothetical protein
MKPLVGAVALLVVIQPGALVAELKQHSIQAFEEYVRGTEARIESEIHGKSFLWAEGSRARLARVRQGEVVIEPFGAEPEVAIRDGVIHDWMGSVFMPGTTLKQTLALIQDYDNHKNLYKLEVIDSRLLSRNGNVFKIRLLMKKKKFLTVVLNMEHDVRYFPLDATRCHSRSYSTRIAEVRNYGKPGQRELPVGQDRGYLWRVYCYWRFLERDGGVYLECEAISLTRGIPAAVSWAIEPIVRGVPRSSLVNALASTRAALAKQ